MNILDILTTASAGFGGGGSNLLTIAFAAMAPDIIAARFSQIRLPLGGLFGGKAVWIRAVLAEVIRRTHDDYAVSLLLWFEPVVGYSEFSG